MNDAHSSAPALSGEQIDFFIDQGFVRIDKAFPRHLADEAREILWRDTGFRKDDPASWTQPVVRLGQYGQAPFRQAINMKILHHAFDQLIGPGRWLPSGMLGTFPVRFPSPDDPGDTGWHVDVSFGTESPDFLDWRVNINSRGRALLMLFLFSDVEKDDAPTRILAGSHLDIARKIAPAGEEGMTLRELAADGFAASVGRPETLATGNAGTVYLCHPFLVHAAQMHRGRSPRFIAQPPLLPREPFDLDRPHCSPVEQAICKGIGAGD